MPHIVIIAGPNGAGKSTTAPALLKETLGITEFVNADTIAAGLSAFNPDGAAFQAGRIMLSRLRLLASERCNFAFETTLATRSYAKWLKELKSLGYTVHLFYLWLPTPEMAVERVAERVRLGGHNVPEETIRRRYASGLTNFNNLYRPLADFWYLFDNRQPDSPQLIASRFSEASIVKENDTVWEAFEKGSL